MTRSRIPRMPASLRLLLLPLVVGCASPLHLQYDYGRAYTAAIVSQADLTRPSVANSQYSLYGTEAEAIRIRVREKTTDEEEAKADLTIE